jgi:hypothetical protein
MSRDPIEERGGLNVYGFVGNGLVNQVDPLGLTVGSVAVTSWFEYRSDFLGWNNRGWYFTAIWEPPTGGDWDKPYKCKPCSKVLWVQVVWELKDRVWPL